MKRIIEAALAVLFAFGAAIVLTGGALCLLAVFLNGLMIDA